MPTPDPFGILAHKYHAPDYRIDIGRWASDRLGIHLWSMQAEIAQAIQETPRVLVRSCHSSGKTLLAAVVVGHWLDQHPPGSARVITTAPSSPQVRGLLWNEINSVWERAAARGNPLPGRVNQTECWIGSYQAGIGRKPSDYKQHGFSGWHAEHVLVVMDEADGIPKALWDSVDTILTTAGCRQFCIGNPDDPSSEFAKMQNMADAMGYRTFRIPAWATPNFTGEEVPDLLKRVLLQPGWVEERRLKWGGLYLRDDEVPDHPFWFSKVEAEYPGEDSRTIVRASDMEACCLADEPPPSIGTVALGIDVAGSERGDETVVRERRGRFAMREWRLRSGDPSLIENFLVECAMESGASIAAIDVGGVGFGFVAGIRRRLPLLSVLGFNFGAAAKDKEHFLNARAELYWMMRDYSRDRKWDLSYAENMEDTIAQTCSVRRKVEGSKKDLLQVESKSDVISRLGRSPDSADALGLAFWSMKYGGESTVSAASAVTLPIGAEAVTRGGYGGGWGNGGGGGILLPVRSGSRR